MPFTDRFVAEVVNLQVRLYSACARLEARTDSEALHDLRIAIRRIRSLLKPLRSIKEMTALIEAAAEVGRQTTPARDLEVLIQELEKRKHPQLAQTRRAQLGARYAAILNGSPLSSFFEALDAWPAEFRSVEFNGGWTDIQSRIRKALNKQVNQLHLAIADKSFDRHKLRVLVKRTRYLTEAFPTLSPLSNRETKVLKELQSALGKWHDHYQWCLKVQAENDLLPLELAWTECAALALSDAEARLTEAAKQLPKSCKKVT
ncbi:CHAD domain-containing protein [Pseudomonas protegens]|uniref:CHAD domain-containing protein n=1 Tax=Pseudomonas protegens TaxID=380021 RepID=UPI00383B57E8